MSFGWLGKFRKGSWLAFRKFILQERRDIGSRLAMIEAELKRIGKVIVEYKKVDENGIVKVTEERIGFRVTPNSRLERLMQVYVVMGGNPMDISHFFIPDQTTATGGNLYPYGGVTFPMSAEYNDPDTLFGTYPGGFFPLRKYIPTRIGGRKDIDADAEYFVNLVHYARRAFQEEIKYKRNNIEAKIVKECDLREQLIQMRDVLITQAFGGVSSSITTYNPDRYTDELRVPRIIDNIDQVFFEFNSDENTYDFKSTSSNLSLFDNMFDDILPEENNTAL